AGASAHVAAAMEQLLSAPGAGVSAEDARLADEIAARASSLGRGAELLGRVREHAGDSGRPVHDLLSAAILASDQAHGVSDIADADIEPALGGALSVDPASRPLRLRLALRLPRRRYRDAQARARAIALLESLAGELSAEPLASDAQTE